MTTRKRSHRKTKKTLKNSIHNYICTKGDICCEKDIDKKEVIEQIFKLYKKYYERLNAEKEYLDWLDNDLQIFIGYEPDLKKNKDTAGIKLEKKMSKYYSKNKKVSKKKMIRFLDEVPLYYLLSCLGYIYYKDQLYYKNQKELFPLIK